MKIIYKALGDGEYDVFASSHNSDPVSIGEIRKKEHQPKKGMPFIKGYQATRFGPPFPFDTWLTTSAKAMEIFELDGYGLSVEDNNPTNNKTK